MSSLRAALEHCYERNADAVYGFALSMTCSPADAEDILQEVFCRLASRPQILDRARNVRAFLLQMTRNLAVDGVRRRQMQQAHLDQTSEDWLELPPDGSDGPNPGEIAGALSRLPEDQRAVIHLKIWEEQTFDEIARVLGIPPGTAASRFRYGMSKLRDLLTPLYKEPRP